MKKRTNNVDRGFQFQVPRLCQYSTVQIQSFLSPLLHPFSKFDSSSQTRRDELTNLNKKTIDKITFKIKTHFAAHYLLCFKSKCFTVLQMVISLRFCFCVHGCLEDRQFEIEMNEWIKFFVVFKEKRKFFYFQGANRKQQESKAISCFCWSR